MSHKKNRSESSSNENKQMQEERMSQETKNPGDYSQSKKQSKKK